MSRRVVGALLIGGVLGYALRGTVDSLRLVACLTGTDPVRSVRDFLQRKC